jgi:hypothetical protein
MILNVLESRNKTVDGCRLLAVILLLALVSSVGRAQSSAASEAHIRASILYNLTKFIDWPEWKLGDAQKPFVVGVVGDNSIADELNDQVRGKQVQGRPIVVQNVTTVPQAEQCHLLFVENSGRRRFKEMAPKLPAAAVLTVSENPLGDIGIVIALPLIANRIQIQVDLKAAQNSGLTISSKLLHLALVAHGE